MVNLLILCILFDYLTFHQHDTHKRIVFLSKHIYKVKTKGKVISRSILFMLLNFVNFFKMPIYEMKK